MVIKRFFFLTLLVFATCTPPSIYSMNPALLPVIGTSIPTPLSLAVTAVNVASNGASVLGRFAHYGTPGLVAAGAYLAYKVYSQSLVPEAPPEIASDTGDENGSDNDDDVLSGIASGLGGRRNVRKILAKRAVIAGVYAQAATATETAIKTAIKYDLPVQVQEKKENKKPRVCPVCWAVLKKDPHLIAATAECYDAHSSAIACNSSLHDFNVLCHDTIGQIIRATGGAFSVMIGAATSSLALSTFFSLIGGILFYKGIHIFKKLIKDDNDARLLTYNDAANIQQYCAELTPGAQENLNSVIHDLECIDNDYRTKRISARLYNDSRTNRSVWSLNKREPDRLYQDTYTALLNNLAQEKSGYALELRYYFTGIRTNYSHDRVHIARWYNSGSLSARLRDYYDDRLKYILYADEEKLINLFKDWQNKKDLKHTILSFADYCIKTVGSSIANALTYNGASLLSGDPNALASFDAHSAMFQEAETTHTIGYTSGADDFLQRIATYINPLITQESLYKTPQEWLTNEPFAQEIEECLEPSDQVSYGQRAFRIIQSALHFPWFQEDNYIVVDSQHNKGLELFDSNGEWRGTANFNGTKKNKQESFVDTYSPPGPEDPEEDSEKEKTHTEKPKITFSENENDLLHMFRKKAGHFLEDTPETRQRLLDLVADEGNLLGPDDHGAIWYGRILKDGRQLWAKVYNGYIKNAGLSDIPRTYNPKTGLCRPPTWGKAFKG